MGGREGGAKVKAGPPGPAPLRGSWGRGGVPTPSGTHPWLGVQGGWGTPWGRPCGGVRRNGRKCGQCFPCPLRHRRACWAPGPNPLPSEPPSCLTEPKPGPTPPPRALPLHLETPSETPSKVLGLNPTHTPSPRALPANSGTPHSRGPLWTCCLSPSRQVLSRGPAPCSNVSHPRLRPTLNPTPA